MSAVARGRAATARLPLPRWPGRALPRVLRALAFPLLLLGLWQLSVALRWVAPEILPAPSRVLETLGQLCASGQLQVHLAVSLRRVVSGFVLGTCLGVPFGLLMGASRLAERLFYPLFRVVCQVPEMAWLPLLMLLFGIGEMLKLVVMTEAVMVPMTVTTLEGVRSIPRPYLEAARTLRLRRGTSLRRLLIPAVLPPMFSGIRLGLGHAWTALVGVELLASTEGVGYLMSWGRTVFQLDVVIACVVVIGTVGLTLDWTLRRIEGRLMRWRDGVSA